MGCYNTALSAKLVKSVTNKWVAIFKGVLLFSVYGMYIIFGLCTAQRCAILVNCGLPITNKHELQPSKQLDTYILSR